MAVESSILKTVRLAVNCPADYAVFDTELIADTNSAFFILYQLGLGSSPIVITGEEESWDNVLPNVQTIEAIKSYVGKKVKLMFDPPQSSYLVKLLEDQCAEFESRISYEVDPKPEDGVDAF